MRFTLKNNRPFVSQILLGIYLVVFILSGVAHTHQEEHCNDKVTTHFHAQDKHTDDCMSCHLLYSFHFVLPQNFTYEVKSINDYRAIVPYNNGYNCFDAALFIFLRGPPVA